ncbi:hypothetical protein JS756_26980 [Streptomyces actuosus]|uniref:Uncharacterized protein n=1 Tax=Streptomyces actuosus TaxID=1885 RepID=A0ABS2VX32_STRAS|nr:hypothetical protein [Streptomyces actuosus]MBN0047687.1 hypothetical protein [Streptomyces actuosus]
MAGGHVGGAEPGTPGTTTSGRRGERTPGDTPPRPTGGPHDDGPALLEHAVGRVPAAVTAVPVTRLRLL